MIELRVLGPISLKRSDGSTVASVLAQPKRLALAAYLAAPPPHGGRCFHRKDTLLAMFWPELDQQRARAALRNALYFLRSSLGAEAVLSGRDDSVGLDPHELWCDLDAFDVAVHIRDFATAYQLYRGAVLEGVYVSGAHLFEEWLDAQRRRRSIEAQEATSQAARRHAAAGRLDDALVWARRARAMAPLNEDAARLLIALRHMSGDRAGAIDEYQRLEALFATEHGVPPSGETQRLFEAIRAPETDPATIARSIAQVPVPPAVRPPIVGAGKSRGKLHDRAVLEACVQARLGLARRRGDRLGVVLVRPEPAAAGPTNGHHPVGLDDLARWVLGGVRSADLVMRADAQTLAVLPGEDSAVDVNALVGRLSRHLKRVTALEMGTAGDHAIETLWLDPTDGEAAATLLGEPLH